MPDIKIGDLHFGDVFLYNSRGHIAELICLFDGSPYSHAGIYIDDGKIMEATLHGIMMSPIEESLAGENYVDAFRLHTKNCTDLGKEGFEDGKVRKTVETYRKTKHDYAYSSLFLLALLTQTRRIRSLILRAFIRNMLDDAAAQLDKLIAGNKKPVTCSELVYLCFSEAGQEYAPEIRGADRPTAAGVAAATNALTPEMRVFLAKYQLARQAKLPARLAPGLSVGSMKLQRVKSLAKAVLAAVPNFVTPGDLSKSPSLRKLGTVWL
jgi:hypothetical protein